MSSKKRRYGVSDLDILLCPVAKKQIIIGKCLQPSCFAHRQAPALDRIGVDEVMSILGDVACYCGRGCVSQLNSKSISEDAAVPIPVIWAQREREVSSLWAIASH